MSLFIDGPPASWEYLQCFETRILDVAKDEGIDLDAKTRACRGRNRRTTRWGRF